MLSAFAAVALLSGCQMSSKNSPESSMTLMERYHSGESLIGDTTPPSQRNAVPAAENNTQEALTEKQREARKHLTRGLQLEQQEQGELAFEQYSLAARLDPGLTEARYKRGRQFLRQGMTVQALGEFTVVTEQSPAYAPGHMALGRVYFSNGLYPEAEKHILTALSHDPKLGEAFELLGILRNHDRRYHEALEAFSAALALSPRTTRIYNNMGLTLSMAGRDAEAIEAFRTAIRKGEASPRTYNNLALALCRLGRYGEAVEAFTAASDEATAWNNLGYFLFLDGQPEQAIPALRRAIELKPVFYVRAAENLKRARLAARFADAQSSGTFGSTPEAPSASEQPPLFVAPTSHSASIPARTLHSPSRAPIRPAAFTADVLQPVSTASAPLQKAVTNPNGQKVKMAKQADKNNIQPASASRAPQKTYALHHSSFRTEKHAQKVAEGLRAKGLSAFTIAVTLPSTEQWHRIAFGNYSTTAAARAARDEIRSQFPNIRELQTLRIIRVTPAPSATPPGAIHQRPAEETAPLSRQTVSVPVTMPTPRTVSAGGI